MQRTVLSALVHCRCRPFVLGAMIGLIVNLGLIPLVNAPAAHAQGVAPFNPPNVLAPEPGADDPQAADPGSPLLAQQKMIYTTLFGGEWDGDGSFYDLPKVPNEPGLLPAMNLRNKLVAVFETVAIAPMNLGDIDNNNLGLPPEDVALLDQMDPSGNLVVGRLTSNIATVEVVCVAIEWNVVDRALDVPTLIVLGSFDAMLSNGGVFTPEDYTPAGGGLEALAAATITCPGGQVVPTDAQYDACINAARTALGTCLALVLTGLAACILAAVKVAAVAAKKCRWLILPPAVKACLILVAAALAIMVASCAVLAAVAAARCWSMYNTLVAACKAALCARATPRVVPAGQATVVHD